MTRDEAKQLLPIIQAYSEGKEIEWKSEHQDWQSLPTLPDWFEMDADPANWRIKPEPIECWAVVDGPGHIHACASYEAAMHFSIGGRVIRMREVV